MYDELTTDLRRAANTWLAEEYKVCAEAVRYLLKESADAIEELSAIREEQKAQIIAMAAEDKPRWIPVTERLPEKMQYVLVRYQNNDMAVASWFGGDEHIRFWRAMTDEGWCADCDTEPTHWMPLPQPPKEET